MTNPAVGIRPRGFAASTSFPWPLVRADKLVELSYGKALVATKRRKGSTPVYGTNGICGWHDEPLFEGPGVILGRKGMGPLGVEWSSSAYWVIDTAYSVSSLCEDLDLRYFYYMIKYIGLNHLKDGTSNPSLSRETFGKQLLPFPPLPVQRAIAQVLTVVDDKIDAEQQLAVLCEALATAYLESITEDAPLRDFANVVREQVRPEAFAGSAVAHFSLPAFDEGRLPDRVPGLTIKSNKFVLQEPSVLVAKLNPHIPRVWYAVPPASGLSVASTEFVVLRPKEPWSAELMWAACAAPSYIAGLSSQVTGTTGSHQRVRPEDVVAAPVADLHAVSDAVREAVEALVGRAHAAREEARRLAALRNALLLPLLSGALRIRDAEAVVKEAS